MGRTRDAINKAGRSTALVSSLLLVSCNQLEEKLGPSRQPDTCYSNEAAGAPESLTGSYIVAFKSEPGMSARRFASFTAEARANYSRLDADFLPEAGVSSIQFITTVDLNSPVTGEPPGMIAPSLLRSPYDLTQEQPAALARVDFRSEEDAKALLAKWNESGDIWFHEPNYLSKLSVQEPVNIFSEYKTKYESLNYWWLKSINVVQAYEAIATRNQSDPAFRTDTEILDSKPIVAVLDSGVDYLHPALADRIWVNSDINASSCKDDRHGCDTTKAAKGTLGNGEVWPFDTTGPGESCFGKSPNCSHGTHVAGIIAGNYEWADPELNRRAAGVCPVCQIMVLKIVGKVGKESGILDSSILAAFKYVSLFRREGSPAVRVINASFGKFVRSRSVGLLVRLLKERHGAIVIGASGNEDSMQMEYPAAFKDAIAVSAVDQRLEKVDFSNFGQWVDISAPGDAILSTVPGAALDSKSGTSMAAPMVSGVAGLMLAQRRDVPFRDLRNALLNAADPGFYGIDRQSGVNYECYYPKIPNEPIRQPLLGRGLLNARDSINYTEVPGQPVVKSTDRVKPGCSTTAFAHSEKAGVAAGSFRSLLIFLILTLPLVVVYSLQVSLATLRKRRSSPVLFSSNIPS